jgi:excisionase family DNA binding protein
MANEWFTMSHHGLSTQDRPRCARRRLHRLAHLEHVCVPSNEFVCSPARDELTAQDDVTHSTHALPVLLTVDEAADLLRTTRRAIYAMVERGQLPGVIRIRRRVLVRTAVLLHWLDQKRAPSPEE